MYFSYYGLKENPFELAPDGSYVYMSETHKEGLATLRYGVIANKGFLLLTGGVGVGKTTILNALLKMLEKKVSVCLLNNPTIKKEEFYHYLSTKLDLAYEDNKSSFILQFEKLLVRTGQKGEKILLIIDEAQAFSIELLEEIRLLSNLAGTSNVFGIFLVGQPEIREQLATSKLLPLRQRIGIRYHLEPLSSRDTEQYIHFRLHRAGGRNTKIFTEEAVATIHEASQGNPRLINILCDHAMLSGFAKDSKKIDKALILESLEELRLPGEATLQTSEVRSRPRPQPSEFIKQPSPQPTEFVSEPESQPDEAENKSSRQQAEVATQTSSQPAEVASQPEPQPAEVASQPEPQPAEVASQPEPQPTEVTSQPDPQPAEVASQPDPQPAEVASQPPPQPSGGVSQPDPQPAKVTSQPDPQPAEVASQPDPQPTEVASQPIQQPKEVVDELRPQSSDAVSLPRKTGKPLVLFMIALALMSVIIVMGIIIPTGI